MFDDVTCPHCGSEPVNLEDAKRDAHLKELGYLHRDITLSCGEHEWTHGVPEGVPAHASRWECDACTDGTYIPRDVALGNKGRLQVVVKCDECLYKPDRPLKFDLPDRDTGNNEWRVLLGHPAVCGNTDDATEHNAKVPA